MAGRAARPGAWVVVVAALGVVVGLGAAPTAARPGPPEGCGGFDVAFTGCVESIGVDLVPTAAARPLVPAEFVLAGDGGPVTPLVVRTARCRGIAVDGRRPRPGVIVQVGPVIVPPDGTGDINNYTLWYYTSDVTLALYLAAAGVPAQFVPTLDYDYRPGAGGGPGDLRVTVPRPGSPPFRLDGQVTPAAAPAGSFAANWWVAAGGRTVKMATAVPQIAVGGADLALLTPPRGQLGQLIGGPAADFVVLEQFNTFPAADMRVSVTP